MPKIIKTYLRFFDKVSLPAAIVASWTTASISSVVTPGRIKRAAASKTSLEIWWKHTSDKRYTLSQLKAYNKPCQDFLYFLPFLTCLTSTGNCMFIYSIYCSFLLSSLAPICNFYKFYIIICFPLNRDSVKDYKLL